MPPHRYWRVYITAVTGTPHLSVTEIEFRSTRGGADQCSGGTAIYSNQTTNFEAAKAFDNSNSTSWYVHQPTYPLPQWIGYDFGAGNAKSIVEFALTCWNVNEMPSSFKLQYSDDASTWFTVYERYDETWTAANQVKVFSASGNGTFSASTKGIWRVRATAVDNNTVLGLSEVRMMTTPGGATVCTGGSALASGQQEAGGPPSEAFDGIAADSGLGSYWSVASTTGWIGYQFPSPVEIQQIQITARVTYQNQSPKDFVIEYYDGLKFVTAWTVTGSSGWASGETRTFTSPAAALTTTAATSQAQHASVSITAITGLAVAGTTSQAQSSAASAATSSSATVATSQAQRVVSIQPLDTAATTRQAQASAGAAQVASGTSASTSQAQSASAFADVVTPWSFVRRDASEVLSGYSTADGFSDVMPAAVVSAGNHILLAVQNDLANTASVTDTAGNTYVPCSVAAYASGFGRLQWFYCVNAIGHASNVITIHWTNDASSASRFFTALHVQSPGPATFDVETVKVTDSNTTSITSNTFSTVGAGFVAAAISSVNYDTEGVWTNGLVFTTPRSTYFRGTGYKVTTGSLSNTTVGITGSTVSTRRLLAVVALRAAPAEPTVTSRQGQTSSASAGVASATSAATSQAQHASAAGTSTIATSASTTQAQASSAEAQAATPFAAGTAQAQSASAEAGVAADTLATSSQAQQAGLVAVVAVDALVEGAQAQGGAGQLGSAVPFDTATSQGQHTGATLAAAYVADVASAQAQQAAAQTGVISTVQGATAQAQGASGEAGVALDASAATDQRQRVAGQVRAESVNTSESGQRQSVGGQLGVASLLAVATHQGQHADLQAGVAIDMQVALGQAQHIGDGNLLTVGVEAVIATAQDRQHAAARMQQYVPRPGSLSPGEKRLHPVLAGTVQAQPALDAPTRVRSALSGRVDLRPER